MTGGGGGAHVCLITGLFFQGQCKLKYFFHFVRLSEMSFSLLVRLDKDLDLCGAISYEKSVGADMCVHQKCPARYRYDGGGGGAHICLITGLSFQGQYRL